MLKRTMFLLVLATIFSVVGALRSSWSGVASVESCATAQGREVPAQNLGRTYPDAVAYAYRSWAKLTEPSVSEGHGGKYVVTYANAVAEQAIKSRRFPFPNGARFIKEGYDDAGGRPGELTTLYIMEKRGRDWYYAVTDPKGALQMEGMSREAKMCSGCHVRAEKTDFIFTAMQPGTMPAQRKGQKR